MKQNKKIILASLSPRRKELLEQAGIDFIIDASSIKEVIDYTLPIEERLMKLASQKAYDISLKYPHDVVIGADTMVCFNNHMIGKAKDIEEAKTTLLTLSNQKQTVYTAVAIYNEGQLTTFCSATDVYFKEITSLIDCYLQDDEWQGKAGSYAIQGKASQFVDHIDGDIDTVIGLPVQSLLKHLEKLNIISR